MGRSTVHYADNQTNNILKALHNKLRPAGTPVQRVEYILELLLLRMFEVKLKREAEFKELRVLFNEENAHQDKLFSYLLTLGSEQILPALNDDFFPFYAEILKHARKVLDKNLNDSVIDQLVLIQEVFANSNFTNNVQSGNLHDIIALIEELDEACLLNSDLLGDAIESALSETGGTKDIGLFRTPDHIRHFMVGLVEPAITDTLIDHACGTGGFLFNAYEYVMERIQAPYRQDDEETLFPGRKSHPELQDWFKHYLSAHPYPMPSEEQTHHFYRSGIYGIEYLGMIRKMAAVNFYVRHLNPANLQQGDSLDLFSIEHHASKTLVLANPPFGAERDKAAYPNVWEDYPKESETTILFVKMMMDSLTLTGRSAIVVSEGFLTWEQGSAKALRKMLLQQTNLQAVIGLPQGVFVSKNGQGPKTSILLFKKGEPTQQVWFYNVENDGYSKGSNRTVIAGCQLVEALNLFHDYVKLGKTPPETRHSFSLSVDWLNVVDPRIKAKISAEVREKLTLKREEAREKLLVRLDKKLNTAKTAKPNSKAKVFTQVEYQAEINQLEQLWEHKIQLEIALSIDKAHLYSFNSSNYRSTLADNQLQAYDELVQHHKPDSNGHSLDQRYAALQQSPLKDAIQYIAHFDPKNAIEADIVREYVSNIEESIIVEHKEIFMIKEILKSKNKYPIEKISNLLVVKSNRIKLDDDTIYKQVKIRLYGNGVELRGKQLGADIKTDGQYVVNSGDFIMSKIDARNGAYGIIPENLDNAVVTSSFPYFNFQGDINPKYLLYIVTQPYFYKKIEDMVSGATGRRSVDVTDFLNMEIPVASAEEQAVIVAQIDKQKAIIEGADKILKNWNLDFNGFEKQFNPRLIDDLLIDSLYGTSEKSDYGTKGYNVLRLGNVKTCSFDLSDMKRVELSEKDYEKLRLKKGDFLIVRSNGNPDLVGKCAVWDDSSLDFVYASYLIRFRFNLDLAHPKFVMYFLSSQSGRSLIKPQAGGGTYNISSTSFKELTIPLPDLTTQNMIVEKLDAEMKTLAEIRQMKTEAQAKIDKLINSIWESS